MTIPEALTVLFSLGLELLEDNAVDEAKQDNDYAGPLGEHPKVVACKAAIAALRREQQLYEVARKGFAQTVDTHPDATRSDLLLWMAQRLEFDGYKALPCFECGREGLIGIHALHAELSAAASGLRPLRDAVDAALNLLQREQGGGHG